MVFLACKNQLNYSDFLYQALSSVKTYKYIWRLISITSCSNLIMVYYVLCCYEFRVLFYTYCSGFFNKKDAK